MHRRQHQQRMLDGVVGENHHRPLGRQVLPEQPGRDRDHSAPGVGVSETPPLAILVAFGQEQALGCSLRPMFEPLAHAATVVVRQRNAGAQDARTVRTGFDQHRRVNEHLFA